MPERRKRSRSNRLEDFLDTPIYQLVDRHRAILEKIKTRENAEYWGHILIGEYYPEVPNSRSASGKMATLVGLTEYLDFCCRWGYYDLLDAGKTLPEARKIRGEQMAKGIDEFTRLLGAKKQAKREIRARMGAKGNVVIPRLLRTAFRLDPGSEVVFSSEGDRIVMRVVQTDTAESFQRIARSGRPIRRFRPHDAYEGEMRSRGP